MTAGYFAEVGSSRPHVVTITSGKGGVGKSTLALNLAIKFAEAGKDVLLLDADANLANLDVMTGLTPKWRLNDVLKGNIGLEDAFVSAYPRLKILAGSSGDPEYPQPGLTQQNQLMRDLVSTEQRFDLILIDTSAGLSREIVNFAIHSDEALVVTNAEPTSVMDAYAMMKIILAGRSDIPLNFVMNAVRFPQAADDAAEKLRTALWHFLKAQARYVGFIPYDENIPRAVAQQQPLVKLYPHAAASIAIQSFARTFASHIPSHEAARRLETI